MGAYDVIIVGTGAGGGTLARHLAPSGKRILLLERGRLAAVRAPELGPRRVRRQPLRLAGTWYDATASPSSRRPLLRRRRDELYGAALYRLRRRTSGARHHDGISPAWPISYDELEPYYTQAEQSTSSMAPWGGSDRATGERALPASGRVARAAHPAAHG